MGETLYDQVVGRRQLDQACRIYAPVGNHETLLAYLVRRLLENGANSSFVNQIVDENVSMDELIADPVAQVEHGGSRPHPAIPLPRDLYGAERRNSSGIDFSNEHALATLAAELAALDGFDWQAAPMLAGGDSTDGERLPVFNPANRTDRRRHCNRGERGRRRGSTRGCAGVRARLAGRAAGVSCDVA